MILAVAPHADDVELGASGLLSGASVALMSGTPRRWSEMDLSAKTLGVGKVFFFAGVDGSLRSDSSTVKLIESCLPGHTVVLSPPSADDHQDHRAIAEACRSAVRRSPVSLIEYETPSARSEWVPNLFVPVSAQALEKQADALKHFVSQSHAPYMDPDWLTARARMRGFFIGAEFAQAFRVVRGTSVDLGVFNG